MEKDNNIEKTKSRLHIDDLEKEDKKQLFEQFVKSGGKIVGNKTKDSSKTSPTTSTLNRKSTSDKSVGNHDIRSVELQNPFRSDSSSNSKNVSSEKSLPPSKNPSIFQVFLRYINCVFAYIFVLSSKKFTTDFKEMTLKKVPDEFMSIKVFLDPIFKQSTLESIEFREHVCRIGLIAEYEMAYHTYYLLDMKIFQSLQATMNISVDNSESGFKKCYAQLILFHRYRSQMQMGTSIIVEKFMEMHPERKDIYYTHARLDQAFSTIWALWYLSIVELINYYWTRFNNKNPYQNMRTYLGINTKAVEIGLLATEWGNQYTKKELQKQEEEIQDTTNTATSFPNDTVAKGVDFIINHVNFIEYFDIFKSGKDLRVLFQGDDQMFYVYAIVDYFDKEFNCLWTGDNVNFHIVPGGDTGRFDAKKEIRVLNTNINQCYELVNEYLRLVRSYKKLHSKSKQSLQYIDQKEKDISRYSFDIRQQIYSIFMKYNTILKKIIETKDSEDSIVGNWNDVLEIKTGYENKLLQNKKIEEAFQIVFEFVSATCWLLEFSDLSGLEGKISKPQVLSNSLINRK